MNDRLIKSPAISNPVRTGLRLLAYFSIVLLTAPVNGQQLTDKLVVSRYNNKTAVTITDHDREPFDWSIVPDGLLYRSYIAGLKEPRVSTALVYDRNRESWFWDSTIGGRIGILRYGTSGSTDVRGWQLDVEVAAMPRLDAAQQQDVESVDYRFGALATWSNGPTDLKFGYTHNSSHIGDEYQVRNPTFERVNYVTESLVAGISMQLSEPFRIYGETGYAFIADGGAEPWQIQFGAEYFRMPLEERQGAPFFAANVHLRQEVDFGGAVTVMSGWQWRNSVSQHSLRGGLLYFNGKSNQFEFYDRNDEHLGFGMWFDY